MRALFLWRAKALRPSLPTPRSARLLLSAPNSLSGLDHMEQKEMMATKKKKKRGDVPVLGTDLPEVWDSLGSSPPAPPPHSAEDLVSTVIDGKSIAAEIRFRIAEEVQRMKDAIGKVPGLAVVMVGQRRDSQSYVRFKIKACQEVGIKSLLAKFSEDCEEDDIVNAVSSFNNDPSVHGILVQLPLPQVLGSRMSSKPSHG